MKDLQLFLSEEQLSLLEHVACTGIENISKTSLLSVENIISSIAVQIAHTTTKLDPESGPPIGFRLSLTPLLPKIHHLSRVEKAG